MSHLAILGYRYELTVTSPPTIAAIPAVPSEATVVTAELPKDPNAPTIALPKAAHPPGMKDAPANAAAVAAAMMLFFPWSSKLGTPEEGSNARKLG